jgi:cytidylate kinase
VEVKGYNSRVVIAIDGPSGAGKGTVARQVAETLGYRHVDTGAMYRAVAWAAADRGVPLDDEAAVAALAGGATIEVDAARVAIDGVDVTTAIRTPAVDRTASLVARLPAVREVLVARQRAMAGDGRLVMEGRDIGTVVFPDAPVKIYLDADPAERARRRAHDPAHQSGSYGVAAVATALADRDAADRSRATSPLAMAADAVHLDTTRLSIADVVGRVLALVEATRARR